MATIESRTQFDPEEAGYAEVNRLKDYVYREGKYAPPSPEALNVASYSNNLMSISTGNRVPMRSIMPSEALSDADMYRFYPYNPMFDRMWKYTYYALYNGSN